MNSFISLEVEGGGGGGIQCKKNYIHLYNINSTQNQQNNDLDQRTYRGVHEKGLLSIHSLYLN